MTYLLIFLAGLYTLAGYVTLEQAFLASETGEDDLLGLGPTIARLRGIDFEERRADRLHLEALAFAHLVETVQAERERRPFDWQEVPAPSAGRLDPLADGPLDPEEFATRDKVRRLRTEKALDRIARDVRRHA